MSLDRMLRASQPDHSPCVGHCELDSDQFCLSCRRHGDERERWKESSEADRLGVWGRLPAAIDGAGRNLMRLPLAPEDIAAIADEVLDGGGAWVAGFGDRWFHGTRRSGGGALTEAGETVTLEITGPDVPGKVRALAWAREGERLADGVRDLALVLVVPSVRLNFPVHEAPATLEDGRRDLGLGLASVRLVEDGDGIVVETPLARVKGPGISASIAGSGKKRPAAGPAGLDLNGNYALGAILIPGSGADPPFRPV